MPVNSYFYFSVLLAVTLFGAVNFRKLAIPFKLLTLLIAITIISESAILICSRRFHSALPVYHVVALYEYIFYSLIYYNLFKSGAIKKIILVSTFIVPLFIVINALYIQPYLNAFPSNSLYVSNILCAIFAMLLYREMLLSALQTSLFKRSAFWYNTAVLFFSVALFLTFGILNYVIKHNFHSILLVYFSHTINYLFYGALWYSLYLNIREQKASNE